MVALGTKGRGGAERQAQGRLLLTGARGLALGCGGGRPLTQSPNEVLRAGGSGCILPFKLESPKTLPSFAPATTFFFFFFKDDTGLPPASRVVFFIAVALFMERFIAVLPPVCVVPQPRSWSQCSLVLFNT